MASLHEQAEIEQVDSTKFKNLFLFVYFNKHATWELY